ncbi:hypothetical protein GW17_00005426 [Ensete ventricosum]|nr:hypothetical protein GW17_00005426 [Ensete ventricosum]
MVAGGTVDWGCFHLVTTRNRAVTVVGCYRAITIDFDHHRSLSGGNGRSRPSPTDFGGRKKKSEKKREKKGENLESDTVLSSLNPDPSPSLREISSHGLLGEKTFLLPAWGKGTRTSYNGCRPPGWCLWWLPKEETLPTMLPSRFTWTATPELRLTYIREEEGWPECWRRSPQG